MVYCIKTTTVKSSQPYKSDQSRGFAKCQLEIIVTWDNIFWKRVRGLSSKETKGLLLLRGPRVTGVNIIIPQHLVQLSTECSHGKEVLHFIVCFVFLVKSMQSLTLLKHIISLPNIKNCKPCHSPLQGDFSLECADLTLSWRFTFLTGLLVLPPHWLWVVLEEEEKLVKEYKCGHKTPSLYIS